MGSLDEYNIRIIATLAACIYFSSTIVGLYALGHRLLSVPMGLIGGAIAQVSFQRASVARHEGNLAEVTFNHYAPPAAWFIPLLLVMIIGSELFSVVFGKQWAATGIYAQILAPWILFVFGSPISTLFLVLKSKESLGIQCAFTGARFASLLIGGFSGSILLTLVLYAGVVRYVDWPVLIPVSKPVCRARCQVSFEGLHNVYDSSSSCDTCEDICCPAWLVVISGCLSFLLYYAIVYCRDERIRMLVHDNVKKLFKDI